VETRASPGRRARLRFCTLARGWPRYYETTPIFTREVLLRAIPNAPGYFKGRIGKWAVDPYAFQPNRKRDVDGMSFFREDFTTPKEVADTNRHPAGARVAKITVQQLRSLGLDVECGPDESQLPGHAIVPGMRFVEGLSKEQKRSIATLSLKLAEFASANGVYCPPGLPDPPLR